MKLFFASLKLSYHVDQLLLFINVQGFTFFKSRANFITEKKTFQFYKECFFKLKRSVSSSCFAQALRFNWNNFSMKKKLNFQLNANGEAKTYLPLSIESERTWTTKQKRECKRSISIERNSWDDRGWMCSCFIAKHRVESFQCFWLMLPMLSMFLINAFDVFDFLNVENFEKLYFNFASRRSHIITRSDTACLWP